MFHHFQKIFFVFWKEGTLYPVVHTLLKKGYISSYDIIAGKRIRVYYKLEASGKDYLISVREEFKKNIQGVFDILEYGEGVFLL